MLEVDEFCIPRPTCHGCAEAKITVVGSMVEDVKFFMAGELSAAEVFPCWNVISRQGGVARNVSENLALLGMQVAFVGLTEPNQRGRAFEARLAADGVRTFVTAVPNGIGRYECWIDEYGEETEARIALPATMSLNWDAVNRAWHWITSSAMVVAETGLNTDMLDQLRALTRTVGVPLCGIPTRLQEFGPRWNLLACLDLVVLNRVEAGLITGIPARGLPQARAALARMLDRGISAVVVTIGRAGVMAASQTSAIKFFPASVVHGVDPTGAGDALTAGLVSALAVGERLPVAIEKGMRVARLTVQCPESACRAVSHES